MTIFHLLSTRRPDPDPDQREREQRARAADERARLRAIVRAEIDAALDDPDGDDADNNTTKENTNV